MDEKTKQGPKNLSNLPHWVIQHDRFEFMSLSYNGAKFCLILYPILLAYPPVHLRWLSLCSCYLLHNKTVTIDLKLTQGELNDLPSSTWWELSFLIFQLRTLFPHVDATFKFGKSSENQSQHL